MRIFFNIVLVTVATILSAQRPNVVVIYTDDHRYTGVHALGGGEVQTPNMDALANDGVTFDRAYLMGSFSGATCIPSRAMLLTGRNLFELQGQGHGIPQEHQTMGETFRKTGYHPHIVGKWHQDNASLARSFDSGDRIMGRSAYLVDHFRMPLWDWDPAGKYTRDVAYLLQYDESGATIRRPLVATDKKGPTGTESDGPHTSELFAESAVEFIKGYDQEKPYFMYLAFHAPHDPRQAPQEYRDLYPPEDITLPPSYLPQHPFDNGHMFLRDEELAPWPRTPEIARQELSDYYAIITHLDAQIGKVVTALKASGDYDNTIIVLAGDSGLAVGCHGLLGKQNIYDEDGIHIPLIFAGKSLGKKGSRREALAYNFDIFPTLCEAVGIKQPASVTGKSLLSVLKEQQDSVRGYTYHAYRQFQRAYRKGDYKLIEYVRSPDAKRDGIEFVAGSRVTQLFNVKDDPWEVYDLSFFPKYKVLLTEMRRQMRFKAEELGDYKQNVEGERYDFWDFY